MNTNFFSPNSSFLYGLSFLVIAFIFAQSICFLVHALKRAKVIGIKQSLVWRTIGSTAVFTIAPAISILLGVVSLAKFLGLPLPWIRLSVIGAITYELPAATSTAQALGISLSETITNAKDFSAIAWVMTLGILPSIIFTPLLIKKIQRGLVNIKAKNSLWGEAFMTSLFMGMISAFSGMVFSRVKEGLAGLLPVATLFFSALIMGLCGVLVKKCKWKWLENYALPFSMLLAMAFAVIVFPFFTL